MYGRPATKGGNSLNKSRKRPSCLFALQIPTLSSIPSAVRKSTNGSLFFGERVGRPGSEIDCCRWLVVAAGIPLPPLAPYPNWNELLPPLLVQSPLTSAHSWCQMSIPKEQDREIFLNAKPRKKSKCLEEAKQGYRIVLCIHSADKKCHPVSLHSTERKEEKDWPGKEGAGFGDLFKCEKTFVHQLLGRRWRRGREETLPVGKRGKRWFLGVFRSFFRFPIQGQFVNLSFWEHEKRLYFSFQAPHHVPPLTIKNICAK